jgi:DNA replication licensing factor MCM5
MKCTPKLSIEAGNLLQNYYVDDRKMVNENKKSKSKTNIPVTVRQLEAIIRLSESIAKMSLESFVLEHHVNEAHRLFKISTLSAATARFNTVTDIPADMAPIILKIEESIKRRLAIGAKVSYSKIIQELQTKYQSEKAISYVGFFLIFFFLIFFLFFSYFIFYFM